MDLSKELVKSFAAAINPKKETPGEKTLYGTAIVDGNNVYVRLDGSTINTPAIKTVEVEDQDRVVVMMKNHTLTITGNLTVPVDASAAAAQAAQDSARNAAIAANEAKVMASDASEAAAAAQDSADQAIEDAATAHDAATTAGEAAESAIRAANTANDNARIAKSAADTAQEAADQAIEDAAAAHQAADDAQDDADSAKESALAANRAANGALNQASVIEDVLDTVTWIAEHGEFTRTTDTTIDPDKVYFIKVGNNYEAVAEPVASDLNKYYNLIVDESMQNYISSHLALTNAGLWVTKDGNAYKILVSNTGIVIYDELGHEVSSFGEDIIFSSDRPQRIGGEDAYIEYYDSDNDGVPDSLRIVGANISMGDGSDLEEAVESAQSQIDLMITPSGASSFVLTQTMIQAMTNQFVIKGSDNTTTVISGGKISANSIKTGDLATDAIKSNNYSYTSGKYSNNGTYLNLANGAFISKNFGIDSNGNAYFKGELTATKLTIAPGATFEGDTSQFKGDKGDPGESVASVTNYYLATSASSGVTRSTSGWTTTIQTMTATNQYLWNYEVVNGSKGTTLNTTDPVIIGRYGQNGGKGDAGRGITSIVEHYQVSSSNTTAPTSWSDSMVNTTTTNKYLWNYETITYTDGTTEDSTKRVIGTHGATGSRGATWYAGTAITGTSTTPTIFSGSGITSAIVGDHYLNTSSQNVYRCTVAGAASVAKWVYEQNIKGTQGLPGDPGPGGATTYFHVKYSNDGGATFTGNSGEDPGSYIGTYSDQTEADSTSVSAYTWVKIEGDKVTASKSGTTTTVKINGTTAATINDGTNGLNNATVTLYRRGSSAPAKPTGNVTYTFATGAVSGSLNSWTKEIPSGTDPVWAIVATASSTGTTDTIGSGEWSDAVKVITNGTNGNPGYNQATIFLYQRAASAPSKPSAEVTYTFSSGALSSVPSGWSRTVPAANGNPCFVTTAVAIGTGTTASIAASAWSDVVKLVEDGADGTPFRWNLVRGTDTLKSGDGLWTSGTWRTTGNAGTVAYNQDIADSPVASVTKGITITATTANSSIGITQDRCPIRKEQITQSVWVKGSAGDKVRLQPIWSDVSGQTESGSKDITLTDGNWTRIEWSKTPAYAHDSVSLCYIVYLAKTAGTTLTVCCPKMEYGSTASEWCLDENEYRTNIGGRNILRDSERMTSWWTASRATVSDGVATLTGSSSDWNANLSTSKFDASVYDGNESVISFDYKSTANCTIHRVYASTSVDKDSASWPRTRYIGANFTIPSSGGEWKRYVMTGSKISVASLTNGSGDVVSGFLQFYNRTNNAVFQMRHIQFEKGNKATDWAPAPEDTTQYFWFDEEGAHISTVMGNPSSGYNSLFTSQALLFRLNQLILMQLTGTDIRFYQNGNERAIFGSNVELKNGNMLMRLASDILKFIIDGNERASFGETVELRSSPFIVDPTDEDWVPEWYKKENIFKIEPDKMSLELRRNPDTAEELTQRTDITAWGIAPVLIKQPTPEEGDIPITAEFILGDGVYAPGKTKLWWDPYNGEINNGVSWLDGECYVSGWVTGGGKELMFTIPLTLPITENTSIWLGSSRTDEDGSSYMELTVRQNGKYILGSASEGVEVIHNSATLFDDLEIWPSASGINVHYYRSSAMSNYTNNDTCGIKVVYSFALINADE